MKITKDSGENDMLVNVAGQMVMLGFAVHRHPTNNRVFALNDGNRIHTIEVVVPTNEAEPFLLPINDDFERVQLCDAREYRLSSLMAGGIEKAKRTLTVY